MAGETLANAVARIRLHQEMMREVAAAIAAEREAAEPTPPVEPTDEKEGE